MLNLKYKIIDESTQDEEDLYNATFYRGSGEFLRLSYQFDWDDIDLEEDTSGFSIEILDIAIEKEEYEKLVKCFFDLGFDEDMGDDIFYLFTNHIKKEEFESFVEGFKDLLIRVLEEDN